MEKARIEKTFTIKYDVVEGGITFDNPDELTVIEILGMLEMIKLIITEGFINGE